MLHHKVYGFEENNNAQTLVFLNGMTQSTAHWKSHGRFFGESYRVVTYDAQGQGDTPVVSEELTLLQHAEDLHGLLLGLEVSRPVLVGFSHGARVAMQYAASYPDFVSGICLCSATSKPTATARAIVRSWSEVLDKGGLEAMSWAALPMILGPDYLDANERMIPGIVRASVERNDPEGVRRLLDAMASQPDLSFLADEISAASIVMHGLKDPLVKPEGAADLGERLGGDVVSFDTGHTIPIEDPAKFRDVLVRFLQESAG